MAEMNDFAERELARRNILPFIKYLMPNYQVNWHHKAICKVVDDFVSGKIKRLMVFCPPQHGKSQITSRFLPTYILGRNPNAKIILASYSAAIAEGMSNNCQKYIDSEEYARLFPKTTLQKAGVNGAWKRNAQEFQIVGHEGYLWAVGAGGSATSKTADYIIIDDPHKDRQEAKSPQVSNGVWDWYTDVMNTRIHNNSGILIIQTRWDFMDLSGRLLQTMVDGHGDDWHIINFKAIRENDENPIDPRKVGEALWPSQHSLERLKQIEKLSLRTFRSLYQQDPQPVMSGGECYKDFDSNEIVRPCSFNPDLTTHVSFDFNKQPYMTCTVWQTESISVGDRKKWLAKQIKEFTLASPKNTTKHVCIAVRKFIYDLRAKLFIYGDPHGMDEDTRSEQGHNDYRIIQRELLQFRPELRLWTKAPNVGKRIEFINAMFAGAIEDIEIQIDPSCTKTIDDYRYIKEDVEGGKFKEMWTDPSTGVRSQRYGHCFVGETLITTNEGDKRIDQIKKGDLVLTRAGYRKVIAMHQNGLRNVTSYDIGGKRIRCTKDHAIWTDEGFCRVNLICNRKDENIQFCFVTDNGGTEYNNASISKTPNHYDTVEKVYDLSIDEHHEYFANGVLVHNCSDSNDYYLTYVFNKQFEKFKTGGVAPKILVGKRKDPFRNRGNGMY